MSDFSMFLKENAKPVETIEYVASRRFVDADGNPVKWILKPVSSRDDNAIKDECIKIKGKDRGFDSAKYQVKLCAASVVFPNLKSVELQDSYGEAVNAYQDSLEKMWIKKLRKEIPYKVNKKVLKSVAL